MDLDRLSEFAAVARGGNIKAVAQELGVPPATLSARLRGFEKELGMELFRRVAGGLALTEAGERLLPSAEEILASLRQLRGELKEAERHRYSRLRIGITGSGLPLYLGPFLDELNLKYPDISLELLDDSRYSIEEGLRSGEVDIYFASVMRDFEIPGLTKTTVTASSQYLLLPRSHRLANRTTVSLRELDGECFIPYPRTRENCLRDFQFRNLEASGISCISVSDVPYPAAPCFFYDRASLNEEAEAFTSSLQRRRTGVNTERLYEFLVLSHVLNYTRAAKALYISQPILTRHIQALEAELGVPLFRRTTHGVTLTEAGRLLSNQAEGLLEKCDRALSLMRERNMPVQGSVRIACELEISYAAQIREFTARFSERYPDIELVFDVIAENTPPSLCTRYDLVFTPCEYAQLPTGVVRRLIYSHGT